VPAIIMLLPNLIENIRKSDQNSRINGWQSYYFFSAIPARGRLLSSGICLDNNPDLGFSISASTRDRRGRTEEHGKDYYFLSPLKISRRGSTTMSSSNGKKCMKVTFMAR
jgi:hypothetical protein